MMKIFLDVGAHRGQTARAVIAPRFAFDQIFCFEPATECKPDIEAVADPRIKLVPVGLGKEAKKARLFGSGAIGASIFSDKLAKGSSTVREIQLIKAGGWINENIKSGDVVFMKLNCEGSECDIIDDLVATGAIAKLYSIMIDFDVRKIPSLKYREKETRKKLRENGIINVCFCEDVMLGETHEARIHHWLDKTGAFETLPLSALREKYEKIFRGLSGKRARFRDLRKSYFFKVMKKKSRVIKAALLPS